MSDQIVPVTTIDLADEATLPPEHKLVIVCSDGDIFGTRRHGMKWDLWFGDKDVVSNDQWCVAYDVFD